MDKKSVKIFIELANKIKLVRSFNPVNIENQKELFFNGKKAPDFIYKSLNYNPALAHKQLNELKIPSRGIFADSYRKKVLELILKNKLIVERGHISQTIKLSQDLFGVPGEGLIECAERLLSEKEKPKKNRIISSNQMVKILENGLKKCKLPLANFFLPEIKKQLANFDEFLTFFKNKDKIKLYSYLKNCNEHTKKILSKYWLVGLSNKREITIHGSERKISVGVNRTFFKEQADRLLIHEVGVHAIRAENGSNQNNVLFKIGFPGYQTTEEGLAVYSEDISGVSYVGLLKEYAGRVIAVQFASKRAPFRTTFDYLKSKGFSDDTSWKLCVRAYRGILKDHIYLQGFFDIRAYHHSGGDLKLLFLGKFGLNDLDLIEKGLKDKEVSPAKYLPKFLTKTN